MEFIDTHTHLYDAAFDSPQEQDAAVKRALEASVGMMILPDINARERPAMISLHRRWKDCTRICAGLHPTELDAGWRHEIDLVEQTLREEDGICAIGEAGMDLYWSKEFEKEQQEAFRAQIDLALEYDLPLVVHAREATLPIFECLESYRGRGLRGVFHAFSGSLETFRRLDRYGDWYVGLGGVLTFKKASIAGVAEHIPLDRILLETDSPYLTPVPHRGTRNESCYIPIIAEFLSGIKGISMEEVASETTNNAKCLFRL